MNNEKELRHRNGWTPAPTKPAYSQTNVSLAHKGRDYDAILRAAKKAPVGYWEDAPRGMKFGESANGRPADFESASEGSSPSSPATTPQSADGPWPKCALSPSSEREGLSVVFIQTEAGGATTAYYTDGTTGTHRTSNGVLTFGAVCTDAGAIVRALEQNGHKDAAAQLRGTIQSRRGASPTLKEPS